MVSLLFSVAGSRFLSAGLNFVASFIVMNELTIESYGDYFFCLSLITFFTTFPNLGVNNSFVFSGKGNDKFNLDAFLVSKLILTILVMILVFSFYSIIDINYIYLICICLVLLATKITTNFPKFFISTPSILNKYLDLRLLSCNIT